MSDHFVTHVTFTIRRTTPASPAQVFAAFADPRVKLQWQSSPDTLAVDDAEGYLEFDFRVGGHERFGFSMPNGPTFSYDAEYFDIVLDQRIVYRYTMHADGKPDSISLVTIEFVQTAAGTTLTYTEQGAFLDGIDDPALREEGTTDLLDNLVRYLSSYTPTSSS